MSKSDMPAGDAGGLVTVPGLDDLPERMRVHALARLLGRTSREVLAALTELGVAARSAQSSIDRKAAEQVAVALVPGLGGPDDDASDVDLLDDSVASTGGTDLADDTAPVAPEPPVLAPIFAPPLFVPPAADDPAAEERERTAAEPGDTAETADTADVADVAGDDDEASEGDDRADPPNTVVKVRAPRERADDADGDGVQTVRGSTRLEAKRQRRRDGRDARQKKKKE